LTKFKDFITINSVRLSYFIKLFKVRNIYFSIIDIILIVLFLCIKILETKEVVNDKIKEVNTKTMKLLISPPSSITSEVSTCSKSPMIHTGKGMRMEGQRDLQSSSFSISCK